MEGGERKGIGIEERRKKGKERGRKGGKKRGKGRGRDQLMSLILSQNFPSGSHCLEWSV